MSNILKKFNCPGRFLESLGYITLVIGLITIIIGAIGIISRLCAEPFSDEEPILYLNQYIDLVTIGLITAIVCPQLFFAFAKVVKAAEKYLSE